MWLATRQIDAQFQTAVQLIHKLATVTARGVVDGNGFQGMFPAQPGVTDRALLCVDSLLHRRTQELHVPAEIPCATHAARYGTNVEVGKVGSCAGSGQRKQCESQRVFVESRSLFKHRDLLGRKQGGEVLIRQNRSQG